MTGAIGVPPFQDPITDTSTGLTTNSWARWYYSVSNGSNIVTPTTLGGTGLSASGANGNILVSDGTNWYSGTVANASKVQNRVSTITGTLATGSTNFPIDNTIPQNTEGDQYMSLSITPANAANILVIEVIAFVSNNNTGYVAGSLFRDSTANAVATSLYLGSSASGLSPLTIRYPVVAGSTAATTFKFRAGSNNGGGVTFNGLANAGYFNGTFASSMMITEYLV